MYVLVRRSRPLQEAPGSPRSVLEGPGTGLETQHIRAAESPERKYGNHGISRRVCISTSCSRTSPSLPSFLVSPLAPRLPPSFHPSRTHMLVLWSGSRPTMLIEPWYRHSIASYKLRTLPLKLRRARNSMRLLRSLCLSWSAQIGRQRPDQVSGRKEGHLTGRMSWPDHVCSLTLSDIILNIVTFW